MAGEGAWSPPPLWSPTPGTARLCLSLGIWGSKPPALCAFSHPLVAPGAAKHSLASCFQFLLLSHPPPPLTFSW